MLWPKVRPSGDQDLTVEKFEIAPANMLRLLIPESRAQHKFQEDSLIARGVIEHRLNFLALIDRPDGFNIFRPIARCDQAALPVPFEELQHDDQLVVDGTVTKSKLVTMCHEGEDVLACHLLHRAV